MTGERFDLVDMKGRTVAGAEVLERVGNVDGSACWRVRLPCGCFRNVLGTYLRSLERNGKRLGCTRAGYPLQPYCRAGRSRR